jgi:two-component system chemotaxis sensor kinase CheA
MADEYELEDMKAIVDEFMVETDELMSQLDTDLVAIEKSPNDLDLLNRIFRSAHTIKGTSGFLGFTELSSLTHKMEDVLNKLRKGELKLSAGMMDTLLECVDHLKAMLAGIAETGKEVHRDLKDILAKLDRVENDLLPERGSSANDEGSKQKQKNKKSRKKSSKESEAAAISEHDSVPDSKQTTAATATAEQSQDDSQGSEEIWNSSDNTSVESLQVDGPADTVPESTRDDAASKARRDFADRRKTDTTIRVDVQRLDSLMNMVGELVLGRNALVQLNHGIGSRWEGELEVEKLNQTTTAINFITTELQMAVMKMRMLPIGNVFNKFPRLVRDLSRDQKKAIELEIQGEETELDKSVIEEIGDPLVHLIRNSCDHGIESPDERLSLGKPEAGKITLIADQEGSNIVIKVIDNGRGLDVDRLSAKAIERGLATQEDVAAMSEREIMNFIFEPGLSTATKLTDVSGRGVGMDVVRTNIEKLNGTIEIQSKKGEGTAIVIKLPLTLAIVQGLLVRVNDDVFAIPLASVLETTRLRKEDVSFINQRQVIRLRDSVLPILNLKDVLFAGVGVNNQEKPYVVVVGFAEKRLGLLVDDLLGQEEVVIRSMGDYLGNTPGIAGATIMGDGRIRLIVDIGGLFNLVKSR